MPEGREATVQTAAMAGYESYVSSLEELALATIHGGAVGGSDNDILAALDGRPSTKLRDLVPLVKRKETGAFFTGSTLAHKALREAATTFSATSRAFDPACGVGDLLVAAARHLGVGPDLATTLVTWGRQLGGRDIHPEFVRAAKARLILLAFSLGVPVGAKPVPPLDDLFPDIAVGDGLEALDLAKNASHLLLNPPYPRVTAPSDCQWGSGKVSQAAIFLDQVLGAASAGTRLVAILPDVLRTGSLYDRWRETVVARSTVKSLRVHGAFDAWADVDVFVLHLVAGAAVAKPGVAWWSPAEVPVEERLGHRFEVWVGPVVPHRHAQEGDSHPYARASRLKAWATLNAGTLEARRFAGRTFTPPFVAVRRTSAPSDRQRAVGTIITGEQAVAVENHLLVLKPRDGSQATCEAALARLRDTRTKVWLDERIRCRHLTVGALGDLPWWEQAGGR